MLSELRIRNLAVIDDVTVRLGPGLNVLTGETGAGKSIVVGALSLLLGERASSDAVRSDAERASIEGVFQVDGGDVDAWLDDHGLDPADGTVILKREIAVEGRNRAWINGSPTTAALLSELGDRLVSLHGQHQHQSLLRGDEQRSILDAFGGHASLAAEVGRVYASCAAFGRQIADLEGRRRELLQREDYLRFQLAEIDAAGIDPAEEERLEDEIRRLSNAEELISLSDAAWRGLATGSDSIASRIGVVRRNLDQLVRIDPSQAGLGELLDSAHYALEELASQLEAYGNLVEHDPDRLDDVRRRQDLLYKLRSKYGPTLADVVRTGEVARSELAAMEDSDQELAELERKRAGAAADLRSRSEELSRHRREAARLLADEVSAILPALGMVGGRFEIVLQPLAEPGGGGSESVEFRVTLNRGFDPRPLAQVASGGELSRVMLALKTILARLDQVPTLVFDEVDAGIGGRVALQVGEKMRAVARTHQVLAITHLPQIASGAHRHLLVQKDDRTERTTTTVSELGPEERVREIARMLGGDPESEASLVHASELLQRRGSPESAVVSHQSVTSDNLRLKTED